MGEKERSVDTGINKRGVKMEEKDKKRERKIKLTKFRITICEAKKADADRRWKTAEEALNAEQEKLRKLEDARDDESWAGVVEAGKLPNYKIREQEETG